MLNEDYKEMLQSLLDHEVHFLIVGAHAMAAYGYPRATGDLDLWLWTSKENSYRAYQALVAFGAPICQLNPESFAEKGIVFQIGVAPRRIDLVTHIDGVDFQEAWNHRNQIGMSGVSVPVISFEDLIKNKQSTGRIKDKLDIEYLTQKPPEK